MPLYNTGSFVLEAVRSILGQSLRDLELIVVDDGSTDGGPDVVAAVDDQRVVLLRLPQNQGISAALNVGVAHARGRFVARMDADDISLPERLARQVAYLDAHADVGALGTVPFQLSLDGTRRRPYPVLLRDRDLRRSLSLQGPFCHGSVMFRPEVFRAAGGYLTGEEPAEDYGLWVRMATLCRLSNLPEPLYALRVGPHSVSARCQARQLAMRNVIRERARAVHGEPTLRGVALLRELRHHRRLQTPLASALATRFAVQHQELACLIAARRGVARSIGDLCRTAALRPRPRSLIRMVRVYREERRLLLRRA